MYLLPNWVRNINHLHTSDDMPNVDLRIINEYRLRKRHKITKSAHSYLADMLIKLLVYESIQRHKYK